MDLLDPMGLELLKRLLLAALCGTVLGLEREWARKPAGLRTQVLVTVGCALFAAIGEAAVAGSMNPKEIDATRIASNIAPGLGFLGAGTIIRHRASIKGLTTAAMIWVNGSIGMAIGFDLTTLAVGATGLALAIVVLLRRVEYFLASRRPILKYRVESSDGAAVLASLRETLGTARTRRVRVVRQGPGWRLLFTLRGTRAKHDALIDALLARADVEQVETR